MGVVLGFHFVEKCEASPSGGIAGRQIFVFGLESDEVTTEFAPLYQREARQLFEDFSHAHVRKYRRREAVGQ
ncbi:MAG TPA: hypothetical protein VIM48_11635 [Chthoniobacterales bacterium]